MANALEVDFGMQNWTQGREGVAFTLALPDDPLCSPPFAWRPWLGTFFEVRVEVEELVSKEGQPREALLSVLS